MESVATQTLLLVFNCIILAIGTSGGPLLLRLYFLHGGQEVWLSSWVQTAGWPINLVPLIFSYLHRRKTEGSNAKLFFIKPSLFLDFVFIGFLVYVVDYFFAYGYSKLPVSTASLILATQLVFNAGFAFLLVKQKFTRYSTIGIVLSTIGAALLALNADNDVPVGETNTEYVIGLMMGVVAAVLFGFILPWIEFRSVVKAKQELSYTLMMESQLVMGFFATAFATLTMFINGDIQAIPIEAKGFDIGETKYIWTIVSTCVIYQCYCLGMIGTTVCGSSLLSGIIITASLPVTEILAVIVYQEKFQIGKGLSLALSLLGSTTYFYGEMKYSKENHQSSEIRSPLLTQNA